MASIGRWLYRLFARCLPCLKSTETEEKETENHGLILEIERRYREWKEIQKIESFWSRSEKKNQNNKPEEEQLRDDDEADPGIVKQSFPAFTTKQTLPAINGSSLLVSLPNEEKADDGKDESEQQEVEYPDILNPFANENEENEYPEELNPFADESDVEADPAEVNQCSPELAPELTPPAINGSSSTVPLPNEENTDDEKDESKQQEVEYPDSLNPFASEVDENQYPEELNPFADDAADTAKGNQSSPELAPELIPPVINGSSATSPLANKRKVKSFKKRRAPDPPVIERIIPNEESAPGVSKTLGSLPIIYKVRDYDEALNRFASKDEEATGDTTGKQSSLAQLTSSAIDGCSSLNVSSKGKNKGKSSKKRRAPDPPVIESKDSASSDIKSNQSSASSFHPGTEKSEAQKKSPALQDRKSP
ncbi:hypothetical protein JTE90_023875 [Oedothorax gibbosus]|uniref:Uncharacterized protein n=1 Tax=Oedothorax gibbosus TaxID=931172 RepID=A0AAV6UM13_9ARAC|nr:hypothetical protein JTE90_023875 [Oedothorax gibbosus]